MGNDEYHLTSYQKVHVVEIQEAADVVVNAAATAPQDSRRMWVSRGAAVVVILALSTTLSVLSYNNNNNSHRNVTYGEVSSDDAHDVPMMSMSRSSSSSEVAAPPELFGERTNKKNPLVASVLPPYMDQLAPDLAMTYPSDPLPFSWLSPDALGLYSYYRSPDSSPGKVFGSSFMAQEDERTSKTIPKPTNMWYENLVLGSVNDGHLTENNRAYTIPYIVDFVGAIPGIRVQFPHVVASDTIVQMATVPRHGLTLGTPSSPSQNNFYTVDQEDAAPPSQLGLGLQWTSSTSDNATSTVKRMRTSVLRGIPYITMHYSPGMEAALSAEVPLASAPIIDGNPSNTLTCGTMGVDDKSSVYTKRVEREVALTFSESDFTWLIFFSRPVEVICLKAPINEHPPPPPPPGVIDFSVTSVFELHVVEPPQDSDVNQENEFQTSSPEGQSLMVRAALANNCTRGFNPLYCVGGKARPQTHLGDLLRAHSDVYPANPRIRYEFPPTKFLRSDQPTEEYSLIHFDWNPRSMKEDTLYETTQLNTLSMRGKGDMSHPPNHYPDRSEELLMYALPHHVDSMEMVIGSSNSETGYCSEGLHGEACLIRGGEWVMKEELNGPPNFAAPRPPHHSAIPSLAKGIANDISFELPDNYMRGAGDTYFSGKMLAKLGRIILVASELKGLAATPTTDTFDLNDPSQRELKKIVDACRKVELPSDEVMGDAVDRLRRGVEVWLNGTAEAPFLYDAKWGGLVSCGCAYDNGTCTNVLPDCPSFSDPGLNFGNGFFNDHHFHYGYHIYAAAVVANFDLNFGRKYFEPVLAMIRDIANPSTDDPYFPEFRQKDWYLGSSWASGIATLGGQPYLNGRNQESSSESIAAYEAISLYGAVMVHAWGDGISTDGKENNNAKTATRVRDMGRLLTATEIRSAARYWHVLHGDVATRPIYPKIYKPSAVGMMWDTMAQFQTWFGSAAYLAYGIQLIPFTSVSERRDSINWVEQMYPSFAESCESDPNCAAQGWSVAQLAMLATVGHPKIAMETAESLPLSVFESAGGNGHSLTNTLWYIATRPAVAEPLVLEKPKKVVPVPSATIEKKETNVIPSFTCKCPKTCTVAQKTLEVGGYSCGARIEWLIKSFGKTEVEACRQVAGDEFPDLCGGCDPDRCMPPPPPQPVSQKVLEQKKLCPPCSPKVCQDPNVNRCPRSLLAPYLCLEGLTAGGCSMTTWIPTKHDTSTCTKCCKLSEACFGI